MSVKRYTNGADDDQGTILPFMEEHPEGDYVEYSDYARLKAEVDALKLGSLLTAVDVLAFINLKSENERLRKAGDYMADHLAHEFGTCPSIEVWNAAKEGKPSV